MLWKTRLGLSKSNGSTEPQTLRLMSIYRKEVLVDSIGIWIIRRDPNLFADWSIHWSER
jgi:hypothetical protein